MKILILGGTVFLGRHLVATARARGHEVTLFNRGQHNPELFPEVEKLRGDRDGGLSVLRGRSWDAAIDTCGYVPRVVRASAELLADAVRHYTFVSSVSVYAQTRATGIDETAPVGTLQDETVEDITGETYGPLKALCEQAAEAAMPGRVFVQRPGLIVGPHDPLDRFTYWIVRTARGGDVLLPGQPERQVQIIDVRDLAEWTLHAIENNVTGIFNATGFDAPLSMGQIVDTARRVSASHANFVWVDEQFVIDAGLEPWSDMPMWIPESEPDAAGFFAIDCREAIAAGLRFRPLEETVRDTLAWASVRPADHAWRAGIPPQREAELLQAWRDRAG